MWLCSSFKKKPNYDESFLWQDENAKVRFETGNEEKLQNVYKASSSYEKWGRASNATENNSKMLQEGKREKAEK